MLGRWKQQLEGDSAVAFLGQGRRAEASEVERLRDEVARLRQERDFLKKAAAFFAKESR
jgi:transposase